MLLVLHIGFLARLGPDLLANLVFTVKNYDKNWLVSLDLATDEQVEEF